MVGVAFAQLDTAGGTSRAPRSARSRRYELFLHLMVASEDTCRTDRSANLVMVMVMVMVMVNGSTARACCRASSPVAAAGRKEVTGCNQQPRTCITLS